MKVTLKHMSLHDLKTKLALLDQRLRLRLESISKSIREIKLEIKEELVTQRDFSPVKRLVYGVVSIILIAVIGAIVAQVI